MGEDGKKVDVEEGEISDTASVEEITEDVFNKQEVVVVKESKPKADSRVWTMQELCKYPGFRGYASGLYNLAWAQAVQNKPLNGVFVMDVDRDGNSRRSSPSSSTNSSKEDKNNEGVLGKEVDKIVIDDSGDEMDVKIVNVEKEEGELEEGEIDLDSEPVKNVGEQAISDPMNVDDPVNVDELETDSKVDLEKRINSIREAMEIVTVVYAGKSFEGVCSGLQNTLESLREVVLESSVPTKDTLIQLYFTAIQAVNSVFCSMNNNLKDQKKDVYSRLLSLVRNRGPLFSPEQMKEIEVMKLSLDSSDVLSSTETSNKEKEMLVIDGMNANDYVTSAENAGHDMNLLNKLPLDFLPVKSLDHMHMLSGTIKQGPSNLKNKGIMLPLLDLHKDHDADSLPSPTRETTPCLHVNRLLAVGDGMPKSELATAKVAHGTVDSKMHPYETDAVKAVSSYQQKFGRSSFLLNDRLPSPTPSEDGNDGDGDVSGEVSSSSTVDNFKPMNPPILGRPIVSSSPSMDNFSNQGLITDRNATPVKASSKSRDPRLRFANSDLGAFDLNQRPLFGVPNATKVDSAGVVSSRKQKNIEESIVDGPALKRLRNGLDISGAVKDVKAVSGSGGWLEDTDVVGPQFANKNQLDKAETDPKKMDDGATCTGGGKPNVTVGGNEQFPVMGTSATTTLPALLKDIPVNPTMLLNILKMGQQQRLAAEAQQKSADPVKNMMNPPNLSSILGAVPLVNVSPSNAPGLLQKPTGILQVPSQITAMDEPGKIRMKPRDPRRVLHNNTLQRSGGLVSEQFKTNGPTNQGVKDNQNGQKQEGLTDTKAMPSPSIVPPDIGRQFTKNLKNIADIISVSQTSASPTIFSQDLSTQPVQIKSDKVDVKSSVSNSEDQQSGAGSIPDVGAAGPSRSPNAWGDVEHLFEGYDDEQRAAIQRERARRIEEQKKMFAASKLCLVLDLDHTLLNSAKFVEVDPVHDEILRKKEEQDREKPYRHLFRFPHMGMWTKLRPGVWNFLEKASKLYELHLYTMGNKLYATEMAKVLDPKGVLFAGRVISRGDDGDLIDGDERVPKSKDLEGVLGMESAVVIIDDSVRVWPHNKLNLIVVERYTYFPCSRRQFGLLGPSLLEIDHDERPEDGTLSSSLAVIERLHQIFFSQPSLDEVDVRNILASEQQKILGGCRIVFSRVFPVGEANPHLHPLWQTAEQFGAVCTNQIDEQVTHVVANSLGTDKVNWALSTGRFVVHPGWVEASALLYRRANEQDFSVKP